MSVMLSASQDDQTLIHVGLALDRIDKAMFSRDAARPPAGVVPLQGLGLSQARERRPPGALDQLVDTLVRVVVVIAPV